MSKWNSFRGGFTFAEILFSVAILGVAVTTVVGVLGVSARHHNLGLARELSACLALAVVESAQFCERPTAPTTPDSTEPKLQSRFSLEDTLFALSRPRFNQEAAPDLRSVWRIPPPIAMRLTSEDGLIERVVAAHQPLWFVRPGAFAQRTADGPGIRNDQVHVVAAFVSDDLIDGPSDPDDPAVVPPPLPPDFQPAQACRTLVTWYVEWTRFQDCEDVNGFAGFQPRFMYRHALDRDIIYLFDEFNANCNRAGGAEVVDYGPLALTNSLPAMEVARFTIYDPSRHVSLLAGSAP